MEELIVLMSEWQIHDFQGGELKIEAMGRKPII